MEQQHNKLNLLQIIHWAFIGSLALLAVISWFMPIAPNQELNNTLKYVLIVVAVPAYFAGNYFRKSIINKIDDQAPLSEKLGQYQKAIIIHWAAIDIPATIAGISFLLTRNTLYLIMLAVFMVLLFMFRPNKERIAEELELTEEQKKQL